MCVLASSDRHRASQWGFARMEPDTLTMYVLFCFLTALCLLCFDKAKTQELWVKYLRLRVGSAIREGRKGETRR